MPLGERVEFGGEAHRERRVGRRQIRLRDVAAGERALALLVSLVDLAGVEPVVDGAERGLQAAGLGAELALSIGAAHDSHHGRMRISVSLGPTCPARSSMSPSRRAVRMAPRATVVCRSSGRLSKSQPICNPNTTGAAQPSLRVAHATIMVVWRPWLLICW